MLARITIVAALISIPWVGGCSRGRPAATTALEERSSCLEDFDHMVATVTASYAGYEDKVTPANQADFIDFTERARARAAAAGDAGCEAALQRWLDFFRDGHLRVRTREFFESFDRSFRDRPARPALEIIDDQFALLRVPTFHESRAELDQILSANETTLASTPVLIIDLRGNDGGSDWSYGSLIPLLYTDPITTAGGGIQSSEASIEYFQAFLDRPGGAPPWVNEVLEQLRAHPGETVAVDPPEPIVLDPRAYPKSVAILIDGTNMSAAETFLLTARQSAKVTLFGSHTKGVVDYLNPVFHTLPSTGLVLAVPITKRSMNLPVDAIDNVGLAPDVRIAEDVDDKILFIMRHYRDDAL